MIDDKIINQFAQPLITQMIGIEADLLKWIASNFDLYDSIGGSLEWKLKQLSRLGLLDQQAIKVIANGSKMAYNDVKDAIINAGIASVDISKLRMAHEFGILPKSIDSIVFDDVINQVMQISNNEISLVFQEISRNVSLEYRKILDVVNLEVTQGISTYDEALKKSLNRLAEKGITSMTYQRTVKDINGNEIKVPVNYSIEGVARRTIVSAITRSGNAHNTYVANELGVDHYAISQHLGARNKGEGHQNHESWQGKVFKISDGEFKRETGEGLVDGLGGVNCRHIKYAYIPNVSSPIPDKIDSKENDKVYQLDQKQRSLERKVREAKKQLVMAEALGDEKYINESKANLKGEQKNLDKFVKDNGLRRDYAREQIQRSSEDQVPKIVESVEVPQVVEPIIDDSIKSREEAIQQFKDSGFQTISMSKIDDKTLIELANGSKKFDKEFPQLKGFVRELKQNRTKDTVGQYKSREKVINISSFYDRGTRLRGFRNDVDSGFSIKNGFGYEHVMVHERTHSVERYLTEKAYGSDYFIFVDSYNSGRVAKEITNRVFKNMGVKVAEQIPIEKLLGRYARSHPSELLAQAISDAISNENPLEFSLKVLEEVKRRLAEYDPK